MGGEEMSRLGRKTEIFSLSSIKNVVMVLRGYVIMLASIELILHFMNFSRLILHSILENKNDALIMNDQEYQMTQ